MLVQSKVVKMSLFTKHATFQFQIVLFFGEIQNEIYRDSFGQNVIFFPKNVSLIAVNWTLNLLADGICGQLLALSLPSHKT